MAKYSYSPGGALNSSVSIDDSRRLFNFGGRVSELAPQQSPFFTYLSKVAKKPTDDPVFKFLEQRHQWQRRDFYVGTAATYTADAVPALSDFAPSELVLKCDYDVYGRSVSSAQVPQFLLVGQIVSILASADFTGADVAATPVRVTVKITASSAGVISGNILSINQVADGVVIAATDFTTEAGKLTYTLNNKGQVIGSAFAEGSTDPEGWADKLYDREGYVQIFKTAIPLYSGTSLATRYRGINNEYKRVWTDKLMEHKMDIEHAMLFGIGRSDEAGSGPERHSWGIIPYVEQFGNIYDFTYTGSSYDTFLTHMENFFAPESGNSGNKLVLTSRKIISYLNKLGSNGFLDNTVGAAQYKLDVANIPGKFGHNVTVVNTIFGNLHFVQAPLLRGMWEDYAVAVDLNNVAYRPLSANGNNRDTHIITNVQNNNVDGRKDMVLTEAGLEISLPETHAILKFS